MTGAAKVTVTIDGHSVSVPAGTNVVDAAHEAGIEIPVFCHHPRLAPVGMCRMCLVEIGVPAVDRATGAVQVDAAGRPVIRFGDTLTTGCTTPVRDGMEVRTETEAVAEARRAVLEFLLTSHPLDCPVCDKGGECPLQNLTMRYGPGRSRFEWAEKYRFPKPVPLGPLIALDRERCVLCARCIRFQDEVAGQPVLGFANRGRGMEVISFSDPPFASPFAGNTTDICPVGALTTIDFRFQARAWEMVGRPGVCAHCAVGCNVMYDTRHGHIARVLPRENPSVNDIWLCDKGRFAHHYAQSPERLTTPLVRRDGRLEPATWDEALSFVAAGLQAARAAHGAARIGGIAGGGIPNEDAYMFGRFLRAIVGTNNVDHRRRVVTDDWISRAGVGSTGPGAPGPFTGLGAGVTVVLVGLDVAEEAPVVHLNLHQGVRRGARLVVVGGRPQAADRLAATVLRWRNGDEQSLVGALAAAVVDRVASAPAESGAPAVARGRADAGARPAVAKADAPGAGQDAAASAGRPGAAGDSAVPVQPPVAENSRGEHGIDRGPVGAAASEIADATDLLVVYGLEAVNAGLVPTLAALVSLTGRLGRAGSGLLAVGPHANSQGVADMGLLPDWLPGYRPIGDECALAELSAVWPAPVPDAPGLAAETMLAGGVSALYVLGTDPAGDDPSLAAALEALDFLVVQELFLTETARRAHVVLPAQSPPERDGTFTSCTRRVQRFQPAVVAVGSSRPGWLILRDLGQRFGVAEGYAEASDVLDEIARAVPQYAGLSLDALAAPAPGAPSDIARAFAPFTAARSVSYLGTACASEWGAGATWPTGGAPLLPPPATDSATRSPAPPPTPTDLLLVPAPCLFDAGTLVSASTVLWPLVPAPYVAMGPLDARRLGLSDGTRVRIATAGGAAEATLRVQDGITPGVVVIPEGLSWPVPVPGLLGGASYAPVTVSAAGT